VAVPATPGTSTSSDVPDPTIPPPTTTPGTPKRVYMPGANKDPVVLPTPVAPTPVKPTPVLPTGPTPILPGSDPKEQTDAGGDRDPPPPRTRRKRERRPRNQPASGPDSGPASGPSDAESGACMAAQSRCRTFVLTGTVLSSVGVAIAVAGGVLIARPLSPVREDPTTVKSFRPPGGVMLAIGGAALISGIAVLASGIAGNRRDQSMRRNAAWWRPRMGLGVITP